MCEVLIIILDTVVALVTGLDDTKCFDGNEQDMGWDLATCAKDGCSFNYHLGYGVVALVTALDDTKQIVLMAMNSIQTEILLLVQ